MSLVLYSSARKRMNVPTDPHPADLPGTEAVFHELREFDVSNVPTALQTIEGLALVPQGCEPLETWLGEDCGTCGGAYGLAELQLFDKADLVSMFITGIEKRIPGGSVGFLEASPLQVWRLEAQVTVADLRDPEIRAGIPLSAADLINSGTLERARGAPAWEIIRTLTDARRTAEHSLRPQVLELPTADRELGRELAVYRGNEVFFSRTRVGALADVVPVVTPIAAQSTLVRLVAWLAGGEPPLA